MAENKTIPSPCISICELDENDICTGCYRSADEITQWASLPNNKKREVILKAFEREKKVNPFLS